MRLLGFLAYGLPFTPPFLYNEAYINKIGLSSSIFVPDLLKVSYMVHLWDLVCGLQFENLLLLSNLCTKMLSRLGAKIYKD